MAAATDNPDDRPRVVIADDDPAIRMILEYTLADQGYEVTSVADGAAAVATVDEVQPDVVVLDLMMPRHDGYGVLRDIRRNHPDLPVIMISGLASDGYLWRAWKAGVDTFIPKPFELDQVVDTVGKLIRFSRNEEAAAG